MVLITGPRQVGKTTLAKSMMEEAKRPVYLSFDDPAEQRIIVKRQWPKDADLVILDEVHKMKRFKSYLKGVFDARTTGQRFIVTGSARLDTFRRGGDSLAGRYFHLRLHPFGQRELEEQKIARKTAFDRLHERGGFPEPYFSDGAADAARWRNQYFTDIVRDDVLEVSRISEVRTMRTLVELLRERVGSVLSYRSLAEDLQIAPNTVRHYIEILEALYIVFLVRPHSKNIARSILHEPKLYFFDSGFVRGDDGVRFENTVAVALQKHCHFRFDVEGAKWELRYVRDKEKHEVDFALVEDGTLNELIEVKWSDGEVSAGLRYFAQQATVPAVQLVAQLTHERDVGLCRVRRADGYLASLSA